MRCRRRPGAGSRRAGVGGTPDARFTGARRRKRSASATWRRPTSGARASSVIVCATQHVCTGEGRRKWVEGGPPPVIPGSTQGPLPSSRQRNSETPDQVRGDESPQLVDSCRSWPMLRYAMEDAPPEPISHNASAPRGHMDRHRQNDWGSVQYDSRFDEYWVLAGSARQCLVYCPWCGEKLPPSKREEWFDAVEALGLDPWQDEMPEEFRSDAVPAD